MSSTFCAVVSITINSQSVHQILSSTPLNTKSVTYNIKPVVHDYPIYKKDQNSENSVSIRKEII